MHGAKAIIARCGRSAWVTALLQRKPYCVAVAALANKLARTAWALLTKGAAFDQVRWNQRVGEVNNTQDPLNAHLPTEL